MKETLLIWKTLISSPREGYAALTPQTRIGIPLLIILIFTTIAGLATLPVITSDAFRRAQYRVSLQELAASGRVPDPGTKQALEAETGSSVLSGIGMAAAVAGRPVMMMTVLLLGAFILTGISLVVKSGLRFALAFRLLTFTAAVLVAQAVLKNILLLASDYERAIASVSTLADMVLARSIYTSLAIFLPAKTTGIPLIAAVDFITDVFHITFYIFLFIGVRTLSADKTAWKAAAVTGSLGLAHFGLAMLPILMI